MGSRLDSYFPPLTPDSASLRNYTDLETQQIASILEDHEDESWSKVPRTYIVLRIIQRLDLLNDLLCFGFTDFWFPVQARSLPPAIPSSTRNAFVKTQEVILTKSFDLEKDQGKHRHFAKGDPLPFDIRGRLGSGAFSEVRQIRSSISFKEYALKLIRRDIVFGKNAKEGQKRFVLEMRIIKSLRHHHIVEFIGSYTDPKYLALIMSPVAEMSLAQFLEGAPSTRMRQSSAEALRSFFGCLATALEYLHSSNIRHRDIKPQKILINNGKILFTDFGLSKDDSGEADSITSGFTGRTPKYCAPEVAEGSSRNSSSDVWSLGCVFLEMIAVLKGKTMPAIKAFYLTNGTNESSFHRNPKTTDLLIEELSSTPVDKKPLGITIASSTPPPPGVFGVPVRESISYAYSKIVLRGQSGNAYLHGKVPIVVAKCAERLKESDVMWERIIYERPTVEDEKLVDLRNTFDDPNGHGKHCNERHMGSSYWFGGLLQLYMDQLPEPIIPQELYESLREPLRKRQATKFPFVVSPPTGPDAELAIEIYRKLLMELPPWSSSLFLCILQLAALALRRSGLYQLPKVGFIATFQPWMLSFPAHKGSHAENRLNHAVIEFLIENLERLVQGLPNSGDEEEDVSPH